MIIGNGNIAHALIDHEDFIFFASGVSDSSMKDGKEFKREKDLLLSQPTNRHLVYFSSLSIYHSTTMYANHKYAMEKLIAKTFPAYTIVRIGNIVWGNNQKTLISYLRNQIRNNLRYTVQNVYRFVTTKEELTSAMKVVINEKPKEINLHGSRLKVSQIIEMIKEGTL